ncbi:MAG: Dabb family protein [Gemmatimonadaceae bacterium]
MFVHAVYFYFRENLTLEERATFDTRAKALLTIKGVEHGYLGVPAATDRPVIERGYSKALVLVFADEKAERAYQVDPIHDVFRDECGSFWTSVRIYDSVDDG